MILETRKLSTYPFVLEPLPFAYDALEPYIDAATVQLHHGQHHQAYITHLNAALKDYPEFHGFSIEELLRMRSEMPVAIRQTVHDQGGGHLHHQLLWKMLKPGAAGAEPDGALAISIDRDFGSFDAFKAKFAETGVKHFASGWVFLVVNPADGELEVFARPDHDNVLLERKPVLLINDLWEHAYYLKYQSRRADYLNAFWNVVNWKYVSQRLAGVLAGQSQPWPMTQKFSHSVR
ncbi:MAG: superoxide dismutase [Sulfuricaulis sp.]|uniref:superoxide dismutase n=1 Tax=Sulfuricaulis sp. TaxID=2003553 RepID=UPI0025FB040E|nr:superoxide dismutase [Sulfuricaulis sp.]MCR4346413.1 superoxide dismutase [Sulfuricaulis sp.]